LVPTDTFARRWLNEPTPASARIATGGPPTRSLQHDIDDAADRVVAVRTAPLLPRVISMRSNRVAWNGGKVHALYVDVIEPASIDEEEGIGGRERAEATKVDAGPSRRAAAPESRDRLAR